MLNSSGKIANSSLGAPKIMINEPNLTNTAINDLYSTQRMQFSNPASGTAHGLMNYHTQMQYGSSSTAHSVTGAAQAAFIGQQKIPAKKKVGVTP